MSDLPIVTWQEHGDLQSARWRSENGAAPPKRVVVADDTLNADAAYHLACEGTAILWRGDYQNAKQLLQAMARRIDRKPRRARTGRADKAAASTAEAFHMHRQAQAQRARTLGMLLLPFAAGHRLELRRAPEVQSSCEAAYGVAEAPYVASLRELLGLVGAYEWRKKGVWIEALGAAIHPHYGVFSPVRGEYIDLLATTPLPSTELAFDIGTGTGVLAAVLAKRGVKRVIATDQDKRALVCARENVVGLGYSDHIEVIEADLFPPGRAPLVVCNPPWIPARPSAAIEYAIYDPESRMLKGFLDGLTAHLTPGGQGWLILSDIAERLGLRTREEFLALIERAGLRVIERRDTRPKHPKATDPDDPLHSARAAEITSLWRLVTR